ncbi:hypothetical protein CU044_2872 [Streptomyces sp. L-9-10]|nr:hypothetical protein CU044_2872 [Streptomyces sp. L-9-10]
MPAPGGGDDISHRSEFCVERQWIRLAIGRTQTGEYGDYSASIY